MASSLAATVKSALRRQAYLFGLRYARSIPGSECWISWAMPTSFPRQILVTILEGSSEWG